jgi:hypothetical protein
MTRGFFTTAPSNQERKKVSGVLSTLFDRERNFGASDQLVRVYAGMLDASQIAIHVGAIGWLKPQVIEARTVSVFDFPLHGITVRPHRGSRAIHP